MTEKVFIFIILIFSFVALLVYDSYLMDQGEIGPVVKMLNYAGLTEYDENIEKIYNDFDDFFDDIKKLEVELNGHQELIRDHWYELMDERMKIIGSVKAMVEALDERIVENQDVIPSRELYKLSTLIRDIKRELDRQEAATKEVEESFVYSFSFFNKELVRLVQQVLFVTGEDVSDFIYLEQEVRMEKDQFKKYFESWSDRWFHNVEVQDQLLMGHLNDLRVADVDIDILLKSAVKDHDWEGSKVFQDAQINMDEIQQLIYHYGFEYHRFLGELGKMVGLDVNRLVADKSYANYINRNYMNNRLPFRDLYLHAIQNQ